MTYSQNLVALGCAVALFGVAPAALAQRGSGGHAGGGHGGGLRDSAVYGGGLRGGGGVGPSVGHRGRGISRGPVTRARGFNRLQRGPFIQGHRGPFIRGGARFVSPGDIRYRRGFVRSGGFSRGGGFGHGYRFVAPVRFFRPYYTFRPRVSVGFGLWVGYPFAYPYAFYNPFYYAPYYYAPYYSPYSPYSPYSYVSPRNYASPSATIGPGSSGSIEAQPSQADMGGLSFDITPSTAELLVDGQLVGTVGDFTSTTQPLGLSAGRHHIEIRAPGYQTMSFDVDTVAGQVIPYQGVMER